MNTNGKHTNGKSKTLDYRLTDVLEMKYSKSKRVLQAVKRMLLHRSIKDSNLYPLPSFILEDALVVIQDGDLKNVRALYLLNAHTESFRTFVIPHTFRNGEAACEKISD